MTRRLHVRVLCIVMALFALSASGCGAQVRFADRALTQAVADRFGAKPGSLGPETVATITELDAANRGIASLEGVAALTALEVINLEGNDLVDLEPLVAAKLPNLKKVRLAGNPLAVSLDSKVYAQVAALRREGVSVSWLPTFVANLGAHNYITEIAQASDGSLVAIKETSLFHVGLFGEDAGTYQFSGYRGYPGFTNIVDADGMVLCSSGTSLWQCSFRFPDGFGDSCALDFPGGTYTMNQTPDGNLLLVGDLYTPAGLATVTKLDTDNEPIWSTTHEGFGGGVSSVSLADGHIVLCQKGLLRLDSEGNIIKAVDLSGAYGADMTMWAKKIVETESGYAVMGSHTRQRAPAVLITFTSDLVVKTAVDVPHPAGEDDNRDVYDFAATQDGGFVLAAHSFAWREGPAEGQLIKIDATGKVVWAREYSDYVLDAVIQTADGGFAIGAHQGPPGWTTFIIKTDVDGLIDGQ